jgi:predicted  nucleic acid-binding Zn-ribbon protein
MSEALETLLQVQAHDTAVDQLRRRSASLPERAALAVAVAEREALARSVAELQVRVDDLTARQAALEEQIAASAARRHALEARMRSGEAFAPRDLEAMDHEAHQLADRQAQLEEDELVLLEEEEPLDVEMAGHRDRDAELAATVERLTAEVAAASREIDGEVVAEVAARDALAASLPPDLAERYEWLRAHLGGVGAARLVAGRCDGCHLTLSSVELERLRAVGEDEVATCPQCDRILVA